MLDVKDSGLSGCRFAVSERAAGLHGKRSITHYTRSTGVFFDYLARSYALKGSGSRGVSQIFHISPYKILNGLFIVPWQSNVSLGFARAPYVENSRFTCTTNLVWRRSSSRGFLVFSDHVAKL